MIRYRLIWLAWLLWSSLVARGETIDFVFDLDGVFLNSPAASSTERIIVVAGARYRLADGAGELLQSLSQIPGARISFFSHATAERNAAALKAIVLPDGRSAFDLAAGRVFSTPALSRESGVDVKDLLKVAPDIDLKRAVLIDDQRNYAAKGQERNLLWLPDRQSRFAESVFEEYNVEREAGEPEEAEDLARKFVSDRNKLLRARGIIEATLEKANAEKISFVEALSRLQWPTPGAYNPALAGVEMMRKGLPFFRRVNEDFRITPLLSRERAVTIGKHPCDIFRKVSP